jgi:hypothetical protein
MRSGWQQAPAQEAQRREPFGPEVSWPTGYYDLEYRDGVYSYPAEETGATGPRGEMPYGEHPYAAAGYSDVTDFGYGDPGYSDPHYEGPGSRNAGDHQRIGNQWSGAYPTLPGAANDPRYDDPRLGEPPVGETAFPRYDETRMDIPPFSDATFDETSFDETRFDLPAYDIPGYGVDGFNPPQHIEPGYGQPQWNEPQWDEPQWGAPQFADPQFGGAQFAQPGYDQPRYDQTGDFAAVPDYPMLPGDYANMPVHEETRFDIPVMGAPAMGSAPFDVDVYRDQAFDPSMIPDYPPDQLLPHTGMMLAAQTGPIPLREEVPQWTPETDFLSDTMLDMQGAALMDAPPVHEFVPEGLQVREFVPEALPVREFVPEAQPERAPAAPVKKTGKRRSGSSRDRRQWVALGTIVVVAAGAVAGVMKFAFPSAGGPAHNLETPTSVGPYQDKPALAQQMHVQDLVAKVSKLSNNQATGLKYAVYQYGSATPGANTQIFMFIGGHLANSDPSSSISGFMSEYPHAQAVSAGPMGGQAACVEVPGGSQGNAAMCTWFDNDSFGTFVSSTMNTAALQNVMRTVRPSLEVVQK